MDRIAKLRLKNQLKTLSPSNAKYSRLGSPKAYNSSHSSTYDQLISSTPKRFVTFKQFHILQTAQSIILHNQLKYSQLLTEQQVTIKKTNEKKPTQIKRDNKSLSPSVTKIISNIQYLTHQEHYNIQMFGKPKGMVNLDFIPRLRPSSSLSTTSHDRQSSTQKRKKRLTSLLTTTERIETFPSPKIFMQKQKKTFQCQPSTNKRKPVSYGRRSYIQFKNNIDGHPLCKSFQQSNS